MTVTTCRRATLPEVALMLDWAAEEGWNPGLDDAPAFHAADPEGFFVAVDQGGTPVAAISVVNHCADFAFLGLYLVRPAFRGQGIGLRLWNHALAHAGDRTVGLDGVEAQQDNYRASGFAHAGGTTRFTGVLDGLRDAALRPATIDDIPALIALEAVASGTAKPAYLSAWFGNTATRTTLVMEGPGGIESACTLRVCRDGIKVGPLIAPSEDTAERFLRHAALGAWGPVTGPATGPVTGPVTGPATGPVTVDVPDAATGLSALCNRLQMTPGFRTARMYRGNHTAPKPAFFAVATLELG